MLLKLNPQNLQEKSAMVKVGQNLRGSLYIFINNLKIYNIQS